MWFTFALALFVVAILCYVPGYLVARLLGGKRATSCVIAPVLSGALLSISGVVIYPLGLRGVVPLLGCVAVCAALIFGCTRLLSGRLARKLDLPEYVEGKFLLVVGILTLGLFFVIFHKAVRNPAWFLQSADNYAHLAYIVRSTQSGIYSMLHAAFYNGAVPSIQAPFTDEGFYPYAFHTIASVTSSITGVSAPICENATWFLFVAIVYPTGIAALIQGIFKKKSYLSSFIIASVVFANIAFPIRMVTIHGIFPNVIAFCCVPSCVYLFIAASGGMSESDEEKKNTNVSVKNSKEGKNGFFVSWSGIVLLVIGLFGLIGMQPNADFFWAVLVFPYILFNYVPRIVEYAVHKHDVKKKSRRLIFLFIAEVLVIGVSVLAWYVVLNSSFMAPTVNFVWGITVDATTMIYYIVNFGLIIRLPLFFFTIAFWIGFIYCLIKKDYRWLNGAFLFCAVILICSLSDNLTIKRFFSGFWYTDPERTAAMVVFAVVPIVAAGIYVIAMGIGFLISKAIVFIKKRNVSALSQEGILQLQLRYESLNTGEHSKALSMCISQVTVQVCAATLIALVYGVALLTPWDLSKLPARVKSEIRCGIGWMNEVYEPRDGMTYSAAEEAFVKKSQKIIGDDSLVINNPYDGSLITNATHDMRVYYREKAEDQETPQSKLIRTKLNQISNDHEVQEAVRDIGAHYVILLDVDNPALRGDHKEKFPGLQITDNTPGFEVVLAEGPYRLYRITAID